MNDSKLTWEQAVQWLREQPGQEALVRACYYDDPLLDAAQRFATSDEWIATNALLPAAPGTALDLGAGRGISSYALALAGWDVTALEPDPSSLVGSGAIRDLSEEAGLPMRVIEEYGEKLPFAANSFDLVYGRQVLHHAHNLPQLCSEVARVLKPGSMFIATREHVISHQDDLPVFLESHALHKLYGGENAFLLKEYVEAITGSGLKIEKQLGPWDSVINYFPLTREEWRQACVAPLARIFSQPVANLFTREDNSIERWILSQFSHIRSNLSHAPGRLYSFAARKI